MESTDKNDYNLGSIRGSRLPVKVQKSFTAAEIQQEFWNIKIMISSFALQKINYCCIQTRKWLPVFQGV